MNKMQLFCIRVSDVLSLVVVFSIKLKSWQAKLRILVGAILVPDTTQREYETALTGIRTERSHETVFIKEIMLPPKRINFP